MAFSILNNIASLTAENQLGITETGPLRHAGPSRE